MFGSKNSTKMNKQLNVTGFVRALIHIIHQHNCIFDRDIQTDRSLDNECSIKVYQ